MNNLKSLKDNLKKFKKTDTLPRKISGHKRTYAVEARSGPLSDLEVMKSYFCD